MLFDVNTNLEESLSKETNGQMLLFVAIVILISIKSLLTEITEAFLSVLHLFLSLIPSKSEI